MCRSSTARRNQSERWASLAWSTLKRCCCNSLRQARRAVLGEQAGLWPWMPSMRDDERLVSPPMGRRQMQPTLGDRGHDHDEQQW